MLLLLSLPLAFQTPILSYVTQGIRPHSRRHLYPQFRTDGIHHTITENFLKIFHTATLCVLVQGLHAIQGLSLIRTLLRSRALFLARAPRLVQARHLFQAHLTPPCVLMIGSHLVRDLVLLSILTIRMGIAEGTFQIQAELLMQAMIRSNHFCLRIEP